MVVETPPNAIKTTDKKLVESPGQALTRFRIARGLRRDQFAVLCGLSEHAIHKIETDRTACVRGKTVAKLRHGLAASGSISAGEEAFLDAMAESSVKHLHATNIEDVLQLGKIIAAMRDSREIGQGEFAQMCGISQPTLCEYETGKRTYFRIHTAEAIFRALDAIRPLTDEERNLLETKLELCRPTKVVPIRRGSKNVKYAKRKLSSKDIVLLATGNLDPEQLDELAASISQAAEAMRTLRKLGGAA